MCVFLRYLSGRQIVSFMRRIMLSSVACPALQYFSTLSHKRDDFRGKKVIENNLCVLFLSTYFARDTFQP